MSDSTQGNGSPQDPKGDDAPKYVTEEQLNRAITARFSDFAKKSEKTLADFLGKVETTFAEKLTSLASASRDEEKPGKGDDPTASPAYKALQKQLDENKAATAKIEAQRAAERAKGRDMGLRQSLTEKLSALGFSGLGLKHAIGVLVDASKAVRYADDDGDDVLMRTEDGDMPLEDGLRQWAKSEDAKLFLPPRGAGGSGNSPGAKGPNTAPPNARDAASQALVSHLLGG